MDAIKCLNSMHLAPKDNGKNLGMTHAALLLHCNQQCQANGLPNFCEQIEGEDNISETDREPDTREDRPRQPPKKWQVCQAFHVVNAVMKVPAFPSGNLKMKQQAVVGK